MTRKRFVVTWVAALLGLLLLALPLGLFSLWWAFPFFGLHVATLWLLGTRHPLGPRVARATGWLGCLAVLPLWLFVLPPLMGPGIPLGIGLLFLGPALLAHLGLALSAGRLVAGEGGARGRGRMRLALYGVGLVGLVAIVWIAVEPFDGRGRRSDGSRAIGDIRTVISAQAAYASQNGGFYDTLACLASPVDCLPGYSESAPVFLGGDILATEDSYRRRFYPGPPAELDDEMRGEVSSSSLRSYAFVAAPRDPGKIHGRAFCGDSSGRLRVSVDGTMPEITNGLCPESLPFLE